MSAGGRISGGGLFALFALGAAGGLIGDMCHVVSGTTVYLEDPLPYVWRSQLWFPLMVGGGTAALGWIRVRFGPPAEGAGAGIGEVVSMVAAVVGLYALTALVRGEPGEVAVVIVLAAAALICARFARSGFDLLCGALAAVVGMTTEAVMAAVGAFEYASDVPQVAGAATWLLGLYMAYGVVVARLGVALAERLGR